MLCGSNNEKVRRWKHETLSTYGIGKDKDRPEWVALGRQLLRMGLIQAPEEALKRQHTPKVAFVAPPADYTSSSGKACGTFSSATSST